MVRPIARNAFATAVSFLGAYALTGWLDDQGFGTQAKAVVWITCAFLILWFWLTDEPRYAVRKRLYDWRQARPIVSLIAASVIGAIVFPVLWWLITLKPPDAPTTTQTASQEPKVSEPLWADIEVSPKSFLLHTGKFANDTLVTITNKGPRVLYGVQLRIKADEPSISIKAVPAKDADTRMTVGPVDFDVFMIGMHDDQKRASSVVHFYQLTPNRPRHVRVYGETPVQSTATAAAVWAESEPLKIFRNPQAATMPDDAVSAKLVIDAIDPKIDFHVAVSNDTQVPVEVITALCRTKEASAVDNAPLPRRLPPGGPALAVACQPFMLSSAPSYEMDFVVRYSATVAETTKYFQTAFRYSFRATQAKVGAEILPIARTAQVPVDAADGVDWIAAVVDQLQDEPIGTLYLPLREIVDDKPNVVRIPAGTKFVLFDPAARVVRFHMVTNRGRNVRLELPIVKQQWRHHVVVMWDVDKGASLGIDGVEVEDWSDGAADSTKKGLDAQKQ